MEFTIIYEGMLKASDLQVIYLPENNFALNETQQILANKIWDEHLTRARQLDIRFYDGYLYRLLNYDNDRKFNLTLGNCRYKDYVVTRTRKFTDTENKLIFTDPLAICGAIITADNRILIGKRTGVDGSLGKYHVVGGFIEREKDDKSGCPSPFAAMKREIYEEVGLSIADDNLICLGIIYDWAAPHPEMCFQARTEMTYNNIVKLSPHDLEVNSWEYIINDPDSLAIFIRNNIKNIAVPGLANLLFLGQFHYGAGWLRQVIDTLYLT